MADFAHAGSTAAASETLIAAWPRTYDRARLRIRTIMARSGPCGLADPLDYDALLRHEAEAAAADTPVAQQAARTLAIYLDVIGKLADGNAGDTGAQVGTLRTAMATLPGDAAAKSATTALLGLLDLGPRAWQRRHLSRIIVQADPAVQIIAPYLAAVNIAVARADAAAARVDDLYWQRVGCRSEAGVQALILRASSAEDLASIDRQAQAQAAARAYTKIAEDHHVLAANGASPNAPAVRNVLHRDLPVLLAMIRTLEAGRE